MAGQLELSLGGLLRQLRAEANLTQEELAEAARLSPRSISDLERGVNSTARKDTALLLASALSLDGQARDLFVAAARGRAPAAGVLAALHRQVRPVSWAEAAGVHGFPPGLTSFIGREAAMRQVAHLLKEYRLVTVTGPGGAGKTRLAVEVARQVMDQFADGAWLVELAAVRDPRQVAALVAAALGVREQPGVLAAEALARVLGRQQLLLVLDNCEHVIAAAAGLCAQLLAAADVRVLATSRERLQVAGEASYRLGPLNLPGPDDAVDGGGCEAVALFVDRARRADAHFTLAGEVGPLVARLVTRLDGMPLAIELAAARAEALGVAGLLNRLENREDRFTVLVTGDRLAAGRQRSLAATVGWSYRLLDERERQVFRWLSVFAGPFTLEGAEAVAGEAVAPVVARLVDCSLLNPPRVGTDGRARYVMLETLRAYGSGLLAQDGEQDAAAAALAGYALRVAEAAAVGLQTISEELAAARWLDAEDATMRQALTWTREHDPVAGLRLAAALGFWWFLRGRLAEGYPLLREVVGKAETGGEDWCSAQFWMGWTAYFSADLAAALGHFTRLHDAVAGRPPSRGLADGLAGRAAVLRELGRFAEAAEEARCSLAVAREVGYPAGEALALSNLSLAVGGTGELDSAVQLVREWERLPEGTPGVLARVCSFVLTAMLIGAGDLSNAGRVCAAALTRSRDVGDSWNLLSLLRLRADLDLQTGRAGDAAAHLNEALQTGLQAGLRLDLFYVLDLCGHLCSTTGRHAEAVTIWTAFTAIKRPAGFRDTPENARRREKSLYEARQALGPAQTRTAEDRGAAMSFATATEYALMLTAPQAPAAAVRWQQLSARGRELVTLVAQGHTDAQIAAELDISIRTVRSHLDRIRDKTGCRRRADLTRLALSAELI